ncbi:MAG: MBL fold metallo-hydrolase [Bacilli bacterium]|jgi:competence protein ComEC
MHKYRVLSLLAVCALISSCQTPSVSLSEESTSVSDPSIDTSDTSPSISYIDDSTVSVDPSDTPLEIYVMEMINYYGDSIYMKYGDYDILIDAGWATDGTRINTFLKGKMSDDTIDLLIATHPHSDHVAGISNAVSGLKVKTILDYGVSEGTSSYLNKRNSLVSSGTTWIKYYNAIYKQNGANNRYILAGDLKLTILDSGDWNQNGTYIYSDNATSVATLFSLRDFTFLTMGDCTGDCEHYMVNNEPLLPRNVSMFKMDHHGSSSTEGSYDGSEGSGSGKYQTNSSEFLNYINPKTVVVSASRPLDYSKASSGQAQDYSVNKTCDGAHPSSYALHRVYSTPSISQSKNVYWNMYAGTMCFSSDGRDIALPMSGLGPKLGYYENASASEKVSGENNLRLHETKIWLMRGYYM